MLTSGDTSIPIACSKCGRKTAKTVAWIERNDSFVCPGCHAEVRFKHQQFLTAVADAEKALASLRKTLGTGAGKRPGR